MEQKKEIIDDPLAGALDVYEKSLSERILETQNKLKPLDTIKPSDLKKPLDTIKPSDLKKPVQVSKKNKNKKKLPKIQYDKHGYTDYDNYDDDDDYYD